MSAVAAREGTIPFRGFETWYRVVGEDTPGKLPLLCLHGGPGSGHDYLEPMEDLATGRRAIFYDQLGSGRSPAPPDPSRWTIELYLDELAAVREALGLERIHLLGQSWGGMLALEYMLTGPAGVESLLLCDTLASTPLWIAETGRLRADLPADVRAVLDRCERDGTTEGQEYQDACQAFSDRHLCRVIPNPDCVKRSLEGMPNEVYLTMWGPSEFYATGSLRDWDVTDRLGELELPTLILSGRHDESTPAVSGALQRGIAGSQWVVFEDSSHVPHVEEPERFLEVVSGFLAQVEAGG
ncbi:MAG: proline iminopeptidase-family hydrolase [Gaiellales bacterium]